MGLVLEWSVSVIAVRDDAEYKLTLDSTPPIQLRAKHPHTEVEHCDREEDPDPETDTPNSRKMILASRRQYNEEDSHG